MDIKKGNIWNYLGNLPIGIPTNGFIKNNGRCVMGRGLAKQAVSKFPNIDLILASKLKINGNRPCVLDHMLFSFPVKPVKLFYNNDKVKSQILKRFQDNFILGNYIPGWMCKADIDIIKNSAEDLLFLMETQNWDKVVLPKVGCGNGELTWEKVQPVLKKYLNNKVIIVDYA